jgi:hypothetical protein
MNGCNFFYLFIISMPAFVASSENDDGAFNNTIRNFFRNLTNLSNPVAEFALEFSIQPWRVCLDAFSYRCNYLFGKSLKQTLG